MSSLEVEKNNRTKGDDPLALIDDRLAQARRLEPVMAARGDGDDPLAALASLVDEARRQEAGAGGEAMAQLMATIEEARHLEEARPYRRGTGDPLERLRARMKGVDPDGPPAEDEAVAAGAIDETKKEQGVNRSDGADRIENSGTRTPPSAEGEGAVGQATLAALAKRPLPAPVRAEVARRLAALCAEGQDERLQEIYELVLFGEL